MIQVDEYLDFYNEYFKEFHRVAVGKWAHLSYGHDKPNDTCSSLESCVAYVNFINEFARNERSLLNAGAGASSWMFRQLLKTDVACCDPVVEYLGLVKEVCRDTRGEFNLGFNVSWKFVDHIYFDYGSIERLPYLGKAIDMARKSIYVDDVDTRPGCLPYRDHVIALCKEMGLKWIDCKEALDKNGRWGIIILK